MNILVITNSLSSISSGGAIYSYGLLLKIAEKNTVDILTYSGAIDEDAEYYYRILKSKTREIFFASMNKKDRLNDYFKYRSTFPRYSKDLSGKLLKIAANEYDAIIIDHLRMAFALDWIGGLRARKILVEHNIETDNFSEQINLKNGWKFHIKNCGLPAFERKSLKGVDQIVCITESDKREIAKRFGIPEKSIVVFQPFFPYKRLKYEYTQKKKLVITGTMSWYPNIEGALWFVRHVFYKILEIDKNYILYIVGRSPAQEIVELNSKNIIITGAVASVDPYLIDSDILIVPNKLGGGAKIKIMEGVLKGIPCIALKESVRGYENCFLDEEFIVNSAEEYINAILKLNKDVKRKENFVLDFIRAANMNAEKDIAFTNQ